jgi:hypothetical protein
MEECSVREMDGHSEDPENRVDAGGAVGVEGIAACRCVECTSRWAVNFRASACNDNLALTPDQDYDPLTPTFHSPGHRLAFRGFPCCCRSRTRATSA